MCLRDGRGLRAIDRNVVPSDAARADVLRWARWQRIDGDKPLACLMADQLTA
jgi:hypothetical protein